MIKENNFWKSFFWGLTIVALALGLIGLYDRLAFGHKHANYGSYVPWGLWVAGYIYLIGLSAGAFLMSALVYVFRVKILERIGKLALLTALATLVGALLTIWMDIGHMGRVWRLIIKTNFRSVMGWMAWLYGTYFVLLLIEFWFAMRADLIRNQNAPGLKGALCRFLSFGSSDISEERLLQDARILRVLGSIGIPLAIAFHGSVGAIFGAVGARPYWNSGLTPIIFLVGALLSGGGLLAMVTAIWGPNHTSEERKQITYFLGRIMLILLALDVLLEWAEVSIGLWSGVPSESESIKLVLFGNFWWVFWFVHLGMGVIIPSLLLLFRSRSMGAVALSGGLIAFTFISVRLNIVIPALAIPELKGLETAFTGPGLSFNYFPSVTEWFLFFFTVAVAALIFLVGQKVLPVIETEERKVHEPVFATQNKEA